MPSPACLFTLCYLICILWCTQLCIIAAPWCSRCWNMKKLKWVFQCEHPQKCVTVTEKFNKTLILILILTLILIIITHNAKYIITYIWFISFNSWFSISCLTSYSQLCLYFVYRLSYGNSVTFNIIIYLFLGYQNSATPTLAVDI